MKLHLMIERERPLPNDWWPEDATTLALRAAEAHQPRRPIVIPQAVLDEVDAMARRYAQTREEMQCRSRSPSPTATTK